LQRENKPSNNLAEEKQRAKYVEELVAEVNKDFAERRKERLSYERQWQLNMNFLSGNQYCFINGRGDIASDGKTYFWQNRSVFNHIAPIIESRLAKFSRIEPTVSVRPKTDDDKDVVSATLSEMIISETFKRVNVEEVVRKVTSWSETCGTGFYKIVWDNQGGNKIGSADGVDVFEGDVKIIAVSPFEIFPDNLYASSLTECKSLIHARVMTAMEVKEKYGVTVLGGDVDVYSLEKADKTNLNGEDEIIKNAVTVIERYEKPSSKHPNGRLITIAGDKLLYAGELPYLNGKNGQREFPFVRQISLEATGNFFGVSVVERLIPVQRAFNAVKNRKHEFLNRLSMGILTVEDGSVDVDDLSEDGLSPGKVLVYRQGAKAPEMMSDMTMPDEFNQEEDRLINEFVIVSGVSDVSSSSSNAALTSGTALEILVEQDNSRLLATAENVRNSYLELARQTIRLFAQFTSGVRAVKNTVDGKTKVYYADGNAVQSDDVYLENENELLYTHSQKKEMIFKLYESGLLTDEQGKLRNSTKGKILTLLGYKDLDYQKGVSKLQEEKAQTENERILKENLCTEEIDDHLIHVDEHTRYVLSEYGSLKEEQKQRFYAHIKEHKSKIEQTKISNQGENE